MQIIIIDVSITTKDNNIPSGPCRYEGQSKITEPYLITFESSKMDIYLDDI